MKTQRRQKGPLQQKPIGAADAVKSATQDGKSLSIESPLPPSAEPSNTIINEALENEENQLDTMDQGAPRGQPRAKSQLEVDRAQREEERKQSAEIAASTAQLEEQAQQDRRE